mmetsp:Transcript_39506/g.112002  ORF Transcript_39506/g.112002 Transcript_39506/m.112002 type:complete len:335 (+) Transcript_39506:1070-2074(+)
MPQQGSGFDHGRARIDLLRPPPSRGKEAGRLPRRSPQQSPAPRDLNAKLDFPAHSPAGKDMAGDWPAPASSHPKQPGQSKKAAPQNVWHRPPSPDVLSGDTFGARSGSDEDGESHPFSGTGTAVRGTYGGYDYSPGPEDDNYGVNDNYEHARRSDGIHNDYSHAGSGSAPTPNAEIDYQKLLQNEYRKVKENQEAKAMRARVIRTGAVRNILDRETIITKALEEANARQTNVCQLLHILSPYRFSNGALCTLCVRYQNEYSHLSLHTDLLSSVQFKSFAKDKLNLPTKDSGVIRSVAVSMRGTPKSAPLVSGSALLRMPKHVPVRSPAVCYDSH